jgi:RsiW-degrading membrane proteinase PrsW (M82 family)
MREKTVDVDGIELDMARKEEMERAQKKIARRWRMHQKEKQWVRKRRAYLSTNCTRSIFCFTVSYAATVLIFGLVGVAYRELSVVLLSIVPQFVVAYFAEKWYKNCVTRCTMLDVMAHSFFFIIPLVFMISFIDPMLNLRGHDTCTFNDQEPTEPWKVALATWGRAAFLEEFLKYMAIRRLVHKPYVVDARSFLVYGFLAGTTFGYLENIGYGMLGGIGLVVIRCFLNVIVHGIWGMLTAADMVRFRFKQDAASKGVQWHGVRMTLKRTKTGSASDEIKAPRTLAQRVKEEVLMPLRSLPLAVSLHGLWNFFLVYPSETCALVVEGGPDFDGDGDEDAIAGGKTELVRPAELLVCVIGFLLLCLAHGPLMRLRVVMLERQHPPDLYHDVHKKIKSGKIQKPCRLYVCPDCCY